MIFIRTVRGFTLVETVIALFVVSVTIAFVTVVTGTIKVTRDSTYENIAFRIADSKLNELRALGYASLPVSGAFQDGELASIPNGAASTTVTALNEKTKQITAGVSWLGGDAKTKYVSLTTLITESGGL